MSNKFTNWNTVVYSKKKTNMMMLISSDLDWDDKRLKPKGTNKALLGQREKRLSNPKYWIDTWLEIRDQTRQLLQKKVRMDEFKNRMNILFYIRCKRR